MTEKAPIGYKLKGVKAEYNEETKEYDVSAASIDSGISMERDKNGKPFFTDRNEAVHFALARLMYHVIVEPIFEEEENSGSGI